MASAFLVGCGVAAGCWTLRAGLLAAKHVKAPAMPNLGAAAPNMEAAAAAAQKLFQDATSRVAGGHPGGFEKTMTRREAAMILGVKCARRAVLARALCGLRAWRTRAHATRATCAVAPPARAAGRASRRRSSRRRTAR
mgnify:CR=1 FL=1